jgi:hypothetical protein
MIKPTREVHMIRFLAALATCLLLISCSTPTKKNEMGLLRPRVREVLDSHREDFSACYKKSLKAKPSLSGIMTVDFEVSDSGKIKRLMTNKSQTTIQDAYIQNCVAKVMRNLSYPSAPSGTVLVTSYPFLFSRD